MLNSKSFLAIDFGAYTLKVGEFQINEAGGLVLTQYGFKTLGQEGLQESTREAALTRGLQELLAEKPFAARNANVCAPGFHTFAKFVKLPPVDTSKVTQIIQYEAQQNVPFPLEEVVWDYQILGAAPSGELEVLLVAIKTEVIKGLFRITEAAGLRVQLVDISMAALCNAFRYNYTDLEGCSLLLDIGAKTSNLLFFEKGNLFARSINIGANAITSDFSRETRLAYGEAERVKIEDGFVSLGGAYEEPENPHQAAVSKIARQVLTRLHSQISQTVQFHRQQGGSLPQRLFLSGGASLMPYTAQFFSEKLNLPEEAVVYLNPFRNVQIDSTLNLEELAKGAHSLGEVVGLALRNLAHCPIELNLMPKSSLKRQQFTQRKPFLAAALGCLILVIYAWGWFYDKTADTKEDALNRIRQQVAPLRSAEPKLAEAMRELRTVTVEGEQYALWIESRYQWLRLLNVLRTCFIEVEDKMEKQLGGQQGVWIERLRPYVSTAIPAAPMPGTPPTFSPPAPAPGGDSPFPRRGPRDRPWGGRGASSGGDTNLLDTLLLTCRAVNMTSKGPDANTRIAQAVLDQLRAHKDWFSTNDTGLTGVLGVLDAEQLTFGFEVVLKLNKPITY